MLTSIIVPAFNRCDLTAACLKTVTENTDGDYEVVLVDNGSTDDTDLLYGAADAVVPFPANRGFAIGCNAGVDAAGGDIVVFLNNDCEVGPGWLPPLVAPLAYPRVGMTGARLTYPDGTIQHSGISFRMRRGELEAWNMHEELPSRDVEGVTGACLAMRKATFIEVGRFDEDYWNGYDDVDLCLAVRAAGYRIVYVAESRVMHRESESGPERWVRCAENVARLQEKWLRHPVNS